jgi:hypothetical protein
MAIVYTSAVLGAATITLNGRTDCLVTLAGAPVGTVYGSVIVNQSAHPLKPLSGSVLVYRAQIKGARVGKTVGAATLKVIMEDTAGPVTYAGALTLTVTDPTPDYFPDPVEYVIEHIRDRWNTTLMPCPKIVREKDVRDIYMLPLKDGVILVATREVESTVRGRGMYKDNRYPVKLRCVRAATRESKDGVQDREDPIWRRMVGEMKRCIEDDWNYLEHYEFDYFLFDMGDGHDRNDLGAGRMEFEWNFHLMAPMRGRYSAPATPYV